MVLWEFFIANLLLCAQRERERERGCNLISFIQSIRGMRCTWPIDRLMTPSGQFQQMTVSRDIARDFFIGPTFLDKISRVSRGKPIFYSSDANTHTHTHTRGLRADVENISILYQHKSNKSVTFRWVGPPTVAGRAAPPNLAGKYLEF